MSVTITYAEFKTFFDRGQFTYSETLPDVRNKDITEAIEEALEVFNQDLYPTADIATKALYYLSAHFLKLDIDASESGAQQVGIQSSRSADGISESIQIPEWMQEGEMSIYSTTFYGQKFLTLSRPYLGGGVYSVPGATQP